MIYLRFEKWARETRSFIPAKTSLNINMKREFLIMDFRDISVKGVEERERECESSRTSEKVCVFSLENLRSAMLMLVK